MIRLHTRLCTQTFAIRHNDAHCYSSDVFSTSPLISLENASLMCSLFLKKGAWAPRLSLKESAPLCSTTKRVQLRLDSKIIEWLLNEMSVSSHSLAQTSFLFTASQCFNDIKSYWQYSQEVIHACHDAAILWNSLYWWLLYHARVSIDCGNFPFIVPPLTSN